jgi:ribonuclease Z
MKWIVAGASHGVPEKHRFCTSIFLIINDNTYIFDAGAPISGLLQYHDIPHNTVKAVFITHSHTDHLNGLPAFCSELMWWIGYQDCDPQFFYPEQKCIDGIRFWIDNFGVATRRKTLKEQIYESGVIYDDGILKVTARQNKHTNRSFSFFVEAENKKILLTGDLGYGFTDYKDVLANDSYDIVFCEGAHHDPGTVNELLKTTPTKQMVIHHLNLEREPYLCQLPAQTPFKCQIAEDGLTVEI